MALQIISAELLSSKEIMYRRVYACELFYNQEILFATLYLELSAMGTWACEALPYGRKNQFPIIEINKELRNIPDLALKINKILS